MRGGFDGFNKKGAKYRSTVLQTAPVGAVCSIVDMYLTVICHKMIKGPSMV